MANMCYNIVEFHAEEAVMEQLENLFMQMAENETDTGHGQVPEFTTEKGEWLFDIRWEGQVLYYETKWSPNISIIQKIADHFKAGFTYSYDESGNGAYGECTYIDGILTDTCLDETDFEQYEYDEEKDAYVFGGHWYESDSEILDALLERKKNNTPSANNAN